MEWNAHIQTHKQDIHNVVFLSLLHLTGGVEDNIQYTTAPSSILCLAFCCFNNSLATSVVVDKQYRIIDAFGLNLRSFIDI